MLELENKSLGEAIDMSKATGEKLFITDRLSCYLGDMLKNNPTLTNTVKKIKEQYDKKVGDLRKELDEMDRYISKEMGE